MNRRSIVLIAALLLAGRALAGGELGDKAAKLEIAEWIKGGPVDPTVADGKHVFVVEFWATWCPPCRMSIPHLTELQKKYKDKNVVVVGITTEDVERVKKFVAKQGNQMDYVVAVDDSRKTSKAYMDAFHQRYIPHAFIIDQKGRVIWHDHPMAGLEEILDKVIAGKFDVAEAKKLLKEREEKEKRLRKASVTIQRYFELAAQPGKREEAAKLGQQAYELGKDDSSLMNRLAWDILTSPDISERDYALALKAAEAANQAANGRDPMILDTYALALYANGKRNEAIETQKKAIAIAKEKKMDAALISELNERLERFRKGE